MSRIRPRRCGPGPAAPLASPWRWPALAALRQGRQEGKENEMKTKMASRRMAKMIAVLVIATAPAALPAMPAAAASGPAPGTGLTGACNMLLDPTMSAIPMTHDSAQGNAGMFLAVAVSGCS
jgi:hypothetical protein